jgi:hypothetical protein
MNASEYLQEEASLDSLIAQDYRSKDLYRYVAVWLYSRNREQFEEVASEYFHQEGVINVMKTAIDSTNQFEATLKDLL